MIQIPRGLARAFRAVARKCVVGRPRGPAPPVVIRSDGERLMLSATMEGINLRVEVPAAGASARTIVMPLDILDAVEGFAVEISAIGSKGVARWEGRDGPKDTTFEAIRKDAWLEPPSLPKAMHEIPPTLLNVLHECGRTAAREATRYAIHRVKLDGKGGTVTGTDGRHALVWSGFKFPFADGILIPAVPALGGKELSSATDVRIGREGDRFFVQAGSWTIAFPIDKEGRYPDVTSVVPRDCEASVAGIDERDATELHDALRELPKGDDDVLAVTIDLDGGVTVRFRKSESEKVPEIRLLRSTWPAVRLPSCRGRPKRRRPWRPCFANSPARASARATAVSSRRSGPRRRTPGSTERMLCGPSIWKC